jgi:hypothetical protein
VETAWWKGCSDGVTRADNSWRQIISQQLSSRIINFYFIFVRSIRSPAGSALRRGPPPRTFLLSVRASRSLVAFSFTTRF